MQFIQGPCCLNTEQAPLRTVLGVNFNSGRTEEKKITAKASLYLRVDLENANSPNIEKCFSSQTAGIEMAAGIFIMQL